MTSQTTMRQKTGGFVSFTLNNQGGTTTIRTTPAGTRFNLTWLSLSGIDSAGGNAAPSLQVDGVTIWAGKISNLAIENVTRFETPLNHIHLGDGVEIIRLVGGAMDFYSLTLSGYDS